MVRRTLAIAPLLFSGACSLALDVDNLPPRTDAAELDGPDAAEVPIDAGPDANPSELEVTSVEPATVLEGTGDANGRPAIFVFHGENLVSEALVTVELMGSPATTLPLVGAPSATADSTQLAIAIRIPVLTDLAVGVPRTLRFTITQGTGGGMVTQTAMAAVSGLGELVLSGPLTPAAALQTYSRISVDTAVHAAGDNPVRLAATAGIQVKALLDGNAAGTVAGPHGCAGGAAAGAGSCTPGGGQPGTTSGDLLVPGGGGGGGGGGAPGTAGSGAGGAPGAATGRPTLVPIVSTIGVAGNRGNGGGGGGKSFGGANGGAGGAGGGVIYLAAGGDIAVTDNGALAATGGTGPASAGTSAAGGGGGGGGGAILVRAGGTITFARVWLSAAGGAGGSMNWGSAGGAGGIGRIRVDAAAGDVTMMATTPSAFRGPAWAKDSASLAGARVTLVLRGEPGTSFPLRLNDQALPTPAAVGADGRATITNLQLTPGLNELCAVAEPGMLQVESLTCIELFSNGR